MHTIKSASTFSSALQLRMTGKDKLGVVNAPRSQHSKTARFSKKPGGDIYASSSSKE
jgi:hypothetical protein